MTRLLTIVSILLLSLTAFPAHAASLVTILGRVMVGGQPDDIAVTARGQVIWGDLATGNVDTLVGGRVRVLVRGLGIPEGIVALPDGRLIVAEQKRDQVLLVAGHHVSLLMQLNPVVGRDGVDGIGWDSHAHALLVPDSPRSTVFRLSLDGRHTVPLASGLGRPVAAARDQRGDILVPDEYLNALVVIAPNGTVRTIGGLPTPDDVVVDRWGTMWVTTLGDGGLWQIPVGGTPQRMLTQLANPQGLALAGHDHLIVVESGSADLLTLAITHG